MTDMIELMDDMYDATTRIDMMWPFPLFDAGEELAEAFDLMLDDGSELPHPLAGLVADWSDERIEDLLHSYHGGESFMEAMNELSTHGRALGVSGFLAKVSTPTRQFISETSSSFSWGHTYHALVFGKDMAELTLNACAWAEARREQDHQRFLDKKGDDNE